MNTLPYVILFLGLPTFACLGESAQEKTVIELPPIESLLKGKILEQRVIELNNIKVTHISKEDLSLFGLCESLQKILGNSNIKLSICIDPSIARDVEIEDSVKRNIFSPYFGTSGVLDKDDLLKKINDSSVYEVIYNMRDLYGVSVGWFHHMICINHGDNTPLSLNLAKSYKLIFK